MPDSESVAAASNDMESGESPMSGVMDIGSLDDLTLPPLLLQSTSLLLLILNMSTAADILASCVD